MRFNAAVQPSIVAAVEPPVATLAGGTRLTWLVDDSVYRYTFGPLHITSPPSPFPRAMRRSRRSRNTATAQVRDMTDDSRATLFANLQRDKRRDLRAIGVVFLPAARDARRGTSPSVVRAARRFLDAWATQPVEMPDPRDADYDARLELQHMRDEATTAPARAAHLTGPRSRRHQCERRGKRGPACLASAQRGSVRPSPRFGRPSF